MNKRFAMVGLVLCACISTVSVVAGQQDEQAAQPTTRPTRMPRIVMPFSEIESLSDEQKQEIQTIRRDILDRMAELRTEERERIMEVLTVEQREQVPEIEEAIRERARERGRQRRAEQRDADE